MIDPLDLLFAQSIDRIIEAAAREVAATSGHASAEFLINEVFSTEPITSQVAEHFAAELRPGVTRYTAEYKVSRSLAEATKSRLAFLHSCRSALLRGQVTGVFTVWATDPAGVPVGTLRVGIGLSDACIVARSVVNAVTHSAVGYTDAEGYPVIIAKFTP